MQLLGMQLSSDDVEEGCRLNHEGQRLQSPCYDCSLTLIETDFWSASDAFAHGSLVPRVFAIRVHRKGSLNVRCEPTQRV